MENSHKNKEDQKILKYTRILSVILLTLGGSAVIYLFFAIMNLTFNFWLWTYTERITFSVLVVLILRFTVIHSFDSKKDDEK